MSDGSVRRLPPFSELFLRRAPRRAVEFAANRLARVKPLGLEPGWHFDAGADDPDQVMQFRRELWTYYLERGIDRPVTFRWYDGLRVRLYLGNDISLCLYAGGSFEPNEFAFVAAVLPRGGVFIDGGANEGLYTLLAARRVGPSGRVLSIEPSSREFGRLEKNIALNRLEGVTPLRLALGADAGVAELAIAEPRHEGQNTIGARVSNPKVQTVGHESVRVESIDGLVAEHGLERVDIIKLDVEGSEVAALAGAAATIERFRPLVLIEIEAERLAGQGLTKLDALGALKELAYTVFVFDAATGQLREAIGPDEPEGNAIAAPDSWRPPQL